VRCVLAALTLLFLGCGLGLDLETKQQALDLSCSADAGSLLSATQYYCNLGSPPPLPQTIACCVPPGTEPTNGGGAYCCPSGTICCPGSEAAGYLHCCNSGTTCHIFKNVEGRGGFDAWCLPAICGGVAFDGVTQCCGATGAPVAKTPIANLADFPDRISRPNYIVPVNGCGTSEHRLPSNWGKADFTPACNDHDTCYGTCPRAKQSCDDQLLSAMDAICVSRFNRVTDFGDRWGCRTSAQKFGRLVLATAIANNAYDSAQKGGCQCCL